jgi:hypothetical protein
LFNRFTSPSALSRLLPLLNRIFSSRVFENATSRAVLLLSFVGACTPVLLFVAPFAPFVFNSSGRLASSSSSSSSSVVWFFQFACGMRMLYCFCCPQYEFLRTITIEAGHCILIEIDTQVHSLNFRAK